MSEATVRRWIQKAEDDLKIGEDEMCMPDPATDMVCFHMQRCAEKYLKAFLIFHRQEPPRTHRLAALMARCGQIDPSFVEMIEWGVDDLTSYATEIRYAEEFALPDLEETQRAITLAKRVRTLVLERLTQRGLSL